MILTAGLYGLRWIYNLNIIMERFDENAPDSSRGAYVLVLIPLFWYLVTFFFNSVTPLNFQYVTDIIAIVGWTFITFLTLKYLYDFCMSYARFTWTNGFFWYLMIYIGYYSVILAFFNVTTTLFLIAFPMISIPLMQDILNKKAIEFTDRMHGKRFNSMTRAIPDSPR